MELRALFRASVLGVVLALPASAQQRPVPLRGVVFDSLRGQPMRDALVSIAGRAEVVTTDARGRFQFDSVGLGPQEVMAQHPILDSIGLSGISAHATVSNAANEVKLAIPSFATLWRAACGSGAVPKDGGIVYGTIRDAARGAPVANAAIDIVWSDLLLDKTRHLRERRWRVETRSNEIGGYAACGVSADLGLQIHAALNGHETGRIDLASTTARVQRRDLVISLRRTSDAAETGTVTGIALDPSGQPVADARVLIESLPEVRTNDDGTFTVPSVPAGTRQLRVLHVGAATAVASVDVVPAATTNLSVMVRGIVALAPVETRAERNVRVFAAEFNDRRRRGFGYVRDSSEIVNYDEFVNVLRSIPSLSVQYRRSTLSLTVPNGVGGACTPRVLIDGGEAALGHLIDLLPREVAAVEVYVRAAHVPPRFAPVGIQPECGIVLVWTKYGMRNR